MAIEEELKRHGIKYSKVEGEESALFKVEELKDANFGDFEDGQLKAANLMCFRYLKMPEIQVFSREEWEAIHQRVKAELEKRGAGSQQGEQKEDEPQEEKQSMY